MKTDGPTFIFGCRKQDANLFLVQQNSESPLHFDVTQIDSNIGPANITVIHESDRDVIVAANNGTGEVTAYLVTERK